MRQGISNHLWMKDQRKNVTFFIKTCILDKKLRKQKRQRFEKRGLSVEGIPKV